MTGLFHEAANFSSSSSSVSLCLTEHVGLVPPPIFRDVCLFLFTCWPTPRHKTNLLKAHLLQFAPSSSPRIIQWFLFGFFFWSLRRCWMVSSQESVMRLRSGCLCFVLAAFCLVMSCHRASGESKSHSPTHAQTPITPNGFTRVLCFKKCKILSGWTAVRLARLLFVQFQNV